MRINTIVTKSILILGCALALIACETPASDAETGTPDPETQEENNNNNNNNTEETGSMLPPEYNLESCDDFAFDACGGDIVGTWTASTVCMIDPGGEELGHGEGEPGDGFADPSCPAQEVGMRISLGGSTFNFNADNTYNLSINFGMELAIWRPLACNPSGISCEMLQEEMNSEGGEDPDESSEEPSEGAPPSQGTEPDEGDDEGGEMSMDWACTTKDDGCLCIATGGEEPEQESGTYTTTDNTVTMLEDEEESTEVPPSAPGEEDPEDDEGGGPPPFKYCVNGTTLQFEAVSPPEEAFQMFITFDKQ